MEHRWGQRLDVEVAVRIAGRPYSVRAARLVNLSMSGAYIRVSAELRRLSRLQVAIALPHRFSHPTPVVSAYVARKGPDGVGVEWCEHAPKPVLELLRWAALHRHGHRGAAARLRHLSSPGERKTLAEV